MPLRGRAAAEAAAAAAEAAQVGQAEVAHGPGTESVQGSSLLPPRQLPLEGSGQASDHSKPVVKLAGLEPAVHEQTALAAPQGSGRASDHSKPVVKLVDSEALKKLRADFDGAKTEYQVQSRVARSGLKVAEGKSLQKRFTELEDAWGKFMWSQRDGSSVTATLGEVQASSAVLSYARFGGPRGIDDEADASDDILDLEQETKTVLAELWDTLQKPSRLPDARARTALQVQVDEVKADLDQLETFIRRGLEEEYMFDVKAARSKDQSKERQLISESRSKALTDFSDQLKSLPPEHQEPALTNFGVRFSEEVSRLKEDVQNVAGRTHQET